MCLRWGRDPAWRHLSEDPSGWFGLCGRCAVLYWPRGPNSRLGWAVFNGLRLDCGSGWVGS